MKLANAAYLAIFIIFVMSLGLCKRGNCQQSCYYRNQILFHHV